MFINQICSQFDERSEELKSNLENELREIKVISFISFIKCILTLFHFVASLVQDSCLAMIRLL